MKKLTTVISYFGFMLGMTLFMAAAHATTYTPESGMNNRYGAIVANLKNATLDDTVQADSNKLDRIRNRICNNFSGECASLASDPNNITNSEKSKFFIQKLKSVWRGWLKSQGIKEYEETNAGGIGVAGDSAASDAD